MKKDKNSVDEQTTEKQYAHSKKTRTIAIVVASILAVLAIVCLVAFGFLSSLLGKIHFDNDTEYDPNSDVDVTDPLDPKDPVYEEVDPAEYEKAKSVAEIPLRGNEKGVRNILLLGIDGTTFKGRSDTMIIMSVNDNKQTVKLVSLLRDTWVSIPGRDKDGDGKDDICKLNAAYAYGGFPLLNQTIKQNFRIDIDEYIAVNFKVLPIIIDAMGGLDVVLTKREMTQIPALGCDVSVTWKGFVPLSGEPGKHHLTGFQALEYARIRKIDSDFKRTERQRKVVTLLIDKAKTMSYAQLISVLTKALEYVSTNMPSDDFMQVAENSVTYAGYTMDSSFHLPEDKGYKGTSINGGSGLLMTDAKASVLHLHEYLYDMTVPAAE